jgi:hypothetical protein
MKTIKLNNKNSDKMQILKNVTNNILIITKRGTWIQAQYCRNHLHLSANKWKNMRLKRFNFGMRTLYCTNILKKIQESIKHKEKNQIEFLT